MLQIVFGMLMAHKVDFIGKVGPRARFIPIDCRRNGTNLIHVCGGGWANGLLGFCYTYSTGKTRVVLCVGLGKLALAGMASHEGAHVRLGYLDGIFRRRMDDRL